MTIKTGKGGFEIDGKVYDFDVGAPDAPGLDPSSPDNGDINVDHSKKDISKKTKITLANYLHNSTKNNQFPIDSSYKEITITDEHNVPVTLAETSNDSQFSSLSKAAGTTVDSPDLRDYTEKPIEDPKPSLQNISKGKTYPQRQNGNELLSSVEKNKLPKPIEDYTSTILKSNRFTDAHRVAAVNLRHVDPQYNPTVHMPGRGPMTMLHLAQVGTALSLRASQEFPAAFNDGFNPTDAGAVAGALLPSPNQIGILKVNNVLLEARDVLNTISNDEVDPASLVEISPLGNQSWGALNNVEEPFAGILNVGQVALALALTAALMLAFEGLGALLNVGGTAFPKQKFDPNTGLYTAGSYTFTPQEDPNSVSLPPNLFALLGIRPTIYPFGDALKAGVAAFFLGAASAKADIADQLATAAEDALENALSDATAAGANIIVARTIIRSGTAVAESISKVAKAFASNPLAGVKSIVGLLNTIRKSKLFAAMNVFSSLGDAILSQDLTSTRVDGSSKEITSKTDSVDDNSLHSTVIKGRLKGSNGQLTNKLAWSSNRAPSMYLIPDSTMTMQLLDNKLGSFKGILGLSDNRSRTSAIVQTQDSQKEKGARIAYDSESPDEITVKSMEATLDAEYVPFYFHDLRTNEIISFHAFIAALTEDFTPAWEQPEGFGRVDPVRIYKGSTGRKINTSFYIAATSEADFDDMWMKINKLVTLVYPQYTRGRQLNDGAGNIFIQPFSQMIGASPMIRLRIGDLIRSNYSKFALARLFGADSGEMQLGGSEIKFSGAVSSTTSVLSAIKKILNDPQPGTYYKISEVVGELDSNFETSAIGHATSLSIDQGDLKGFKFKLINAVDVNVAMQADVMSPSELIDEYGIDTLTATKWNGQLQTKYNNVDNIKQFVVGGTYKINRSMLRLTKQLYDKTVNDATGGSGTDSLNRLSEFLDDEKNALVRSFKSIKGKGLAGTIDSMQFDWFDKVTWEVAPGKAAPKLCKVTLAFTPIHDISPGIDHNGYNRAPVYPVGAAMAHRIEQDGKG
jgi:hypothetical protein